MYYYNLSLQNATSNANNLFCQIEQTHQHTLRMSNKASSSVTAFEIACNVPRVIMVVGKCEQKPFPTWPKVSITSFRPNVVLHNLRRQSSHSLSCTNNQYTDLIKSCVFSESTNILCQLLNTIFKHNVKTEALLPSYDARYS